MQQFWIFPTTVCPTDPTNGILLVGDTQQIDQADEVFSVSEYNGAAFGRSIGNLACTNGVITWEQRGGTPSPILGTSGLFHGERHIGNVLRRNDGCFVFVLDESYKLKLDRSSPEMLCPKCGHVQFCLPTRHAFRCGDCHHLVDHAWVRFIRHYAESTTFRTAMVASRAGSRGMRIIDA